VERLVSRNGFTEEEARRRLAAQIPIDEKVARSTYVIDNGGSLESTRAQTEAVWKRITG
jgi:dephospho-CoA kinase